MPEMNSSTEQWVVVPGFSKYEASNLGRIRNLRRGDVIKGGISAKGYAYVNIVSDERPNTYIHLHRLIAFAWCSGYSAGLEVNHKDGNKLNNHSSNLEWVTHRENMIHMHQSGLRKQKHPKMIKVVDTRTGEVYESMQAAARANKIIQTTMMRWITGRRKNKSPFRKYEEAQAA